MSCPLHEKCKRALSLGQRFRGCHGCAKAAELESQFQTPPRCTVKRILPSPTGWFLGQSERGDWGCTTRDHGDKQRSRCETCCVHFSRCHVVLQPAEVASVSLLGCPAATVPSGKASQFLRRKEKVGGLEIWLS